MEIKSDITKEQYTDLVNRIYDYALWFDSEYSQKEEHEEFEKGMRYAYWTILDTIKNQLEADRIETDIDIKKVCEEYRNKQEE